MTGQKIPEKSDPVSRECCCAMETMAQDRRPISIACMLTATSSWHQEGVQFYRENSAAWKPDYERQLKQGKVKNEAEYIQKKVNGFMN